MKWLALGLVAACGGGASAPVDATAPDATPIPADTIPCDAPQHWPLSLRSAVNPVVVHYQSAGDAAMAQHVLDDVDHSWTIETGALHFRPPIDDGGRCGDDGAFDVYLWRGEEECYVDVLDENPATAWDDRVAYLVVDPWGPYGGDLLDTTVAHELDHAMQAADDWSDVPIVYEMTSEFIESAVYPDARDEVRDLIPDFQAHPEWSIDHDDGYATWYMYGSALYLSFLRDTYFGGDPSFIGDLWLGLRSPIDDDEPDFEDSIDQLLAPSGSSFRDSVAAFASWRANPTGYAPAARAATVTAPGSVPIAVMMYGSQYIDTPLTPSLADASTAVDWSVADLGGTVVVTALPKGAGDPDQRTDTYHHATLVLR